MSLGLWLLFLADGARARPVAVNDQRAGARVGDHAMSRSPGPRFKTSGPHAGEGQQPRASDST